MLCIHSFIARPVACSQADLEETQNAGARLVGREGVGCMGWERIEGRIVVVGTVDTQALVKNGYGLFFAD